MSITFSGLATGLDTNKIIDGLMAVERAPLDRLETKKTFETNKLGAYDQLSSKLKDLKNIVGGMHITSQIRSTSASYPSDAPFTAETSGGALGDYNVSVAQLSQVQKTISDGFNSKTDPIFGNGTITVNGKEIVINDDNNSLVGIVQAINNFDDNTGVPIGVKATIINDGSQNNAYHLVLTGQDADTIFTIGTDLQDTSSQPITVGFDDVQEAQEAIAYIDGIKIVSNSNTISDVISGVTLTLTSLSEQTYAGNATADEIANNVKPHDWATPPLYESTSLKIESDTDALKEKITEFVTAYNGIIDWINSGYEEFGGSSEVVESADEDEETRLGALLRGDASVHGIKRQLQGILTDTVNNDGTFQILTEIGIFTDKRDGKLHQDNSVLDKALDENFDDVVYLLAGNDKTEGAMKKFNSLLLDLTSSSKGIYALQKDSYDSKIRTYDSKIELMEVRMTKRESILRAQFTAMEQLVSSLNAQGDFLTQQMNALNKDN